MLTKEKLNEQLQDFPEEFSVDQVVERLLFIEKVERGIQQSKENNVIPHEELENEIKK